MTRIASGEWAERIPGDHDLRRELRIGAGTAVKARALLAADGVLVKRRPVRAWRPAISPAEAREWLEREPPG